MSSDFPFSINDVLSLNGLGHPSGRTSVRISCPFCSANKINRNLGIDLISEKFHCYSCGISGRGGTQFHAFLHNMDSKTAFNDIKSSLGITTENPKIQRPLPEIQVPIDTNYPEAPEQVLNKNYCMMLEQMALSEKHKKDLMGRGFNMSELRDLGYVSYITPFSEGINPELFNIPKKLIEAGCDLKGTPGFYTTQTKNVWRLPLMKDGILVPYRSYNNNIVFIQNRKDNECLDEYENKYSCLSSNEKKDGTKASTKVHYATDFVWVNNAFQPILKNGIVVITEGGMKADLAHKISGVPFIALPGITSAIDALVEAINKLKKLGLKKVIFAFDMDKLFNVNVAEGIEKLKLVLKEKCGIDVEELSWSNTFMTLEKQTLKFDIKTDFVFTPKTLQYYIDNKRVDEIFKRVVKLNKKQIYFALAGSADATKENKENFQLLKKMCEEYKLPCNTIFWSLRLKGIDDYYAHKERNIEYQ